MKWACLIFAMATMPAARGFANDRYEELREEAWQSLSEQSSHSGMESIAPVPDAELDLGGQVLSLDALLNEVQRRNPSLESALNAWRSALAEYPQARALEDPMISYSVAPQTLDRPRDGAGRMDQGHVIEISQSLPWPGKRRLRGNIALLEAQSAHASIETVRQELALEATMAFYELWYVYRALEINAVNQSLLSEFQTIAESKYAAGTASKQDALQAEVEREHLAHLEIVLNRMLEVTRARINLLLNRGPDSPVPPPADLIELPTAMPELDSLLAAALANRPELGALQSEVDARDASVELARKEYRPDFRVMAGYNSMWTNNEDRFMIGFGFNLPIQLGKRRGAVDRARAEHRRSEADLAQQASQISFEVKEAYEMLNENHHVVDLYRIRLLPAAEESLDAAQSGYESAEVDFLALIAAQKLLMDTQLNHYRALASYRQAAAELERAVGGPLRIASTSIEELVR